MTSFAWKPRDCFGICFKRSETKRSFLYIIMHLHCFICILIYILRSNERCPWNNSLKDWGKVNIDRFNSWVYVWFIWITFVAVHRQKWMTLTMFKLKQAISCRTRCETSSCNESQHFGRCCSFFWPVDGHCMNHFTTLRVMNLFPIQLGLKLHWFRTLHFTITTKSWENHGTLSMMKKETNFPFRNECLFCPLNFVNTCESAVVRVQVDCLLNLWTLDFD